MAATHNVETVATAMNSWVERMVCEIEWKWNGPLLSVACHVASPMTTVRASVAPRCPKRRPAQIRPGNARYSRAFGLEKATAVSAHVVASIKIASARCLSESLLQGRDQAMANGTTTRAPQASPSHHVRHTCANASALTTSPR
jgi:hypothetical protein